MTEDQQIREMLKEITSTSEYKQELVRLTDNPVCMASLLDSIEVNNAKASNQTV